MNSQNSLFPQFSSPGERQLLLSSGSPVSSSLKIHHRSGIQFHSKGKLQQATGAIAMYRFKVQIFTKPRGMLETVMSARSIGQARMLAQEQYPGANIARIIQVG